MSRSHPTHPDILLNPESLIHTSSITAVGSAALDTIETPQGKAVEALGGSVTYIGAIASLFAPVNIVAVVGSDFDMKRYDFLRERGVNLDGLEVAEGRTFRWSGRYHADMNQRDTLSTELGVFEGFNPLLPERAQKAEFLLLANIDPALQLKVLEQTDSARLIAFDTMNLWINICREEVEAMLRKVDLVTLNDEEIHLLTGEKSPLKGARKILKYGPSWVVVKKGEHGSLLIGREVEPFLCPAYPIDEAVDPTGAGDTFAGAMMGYLAATGDITSLNVRRAVAYGAVAASFTVEAFGVDRLRTLTLDEVEARFHTFQEMVEF